MCASADMDTDELLKAIKKKCLDCSCGCMRSVEQCEVKDCALYAYRPQRQKRTKKKEKQLTIFDMEGYHESSTVGMANGKGMD